MSGKLYRIKPLVWEPNITNIIADTVFGSYYSTDLGNLVFRGYGQEPEMLSSSLPLDKLKAAAQRDYESRLISAGVVEEAK